MAVGAISTLLSCTPCIYIGLLTLDPNDEIEILQQLSPFETSRLIRRPVSASPHFSKWNPTQYKLDIVRFLDSGSFDYIFWMDSDTLTYSDISKTLLEFINSPASFLMTPDHVMKDPTFLSLWKVQNGKPAPTIPQSCFMGFKANVLFDFISFWEREWASWLTPEPFAVHKDPRPHFRGSAFCIEQYALGNALSEFVSVYGMDPSAAVMWFGREIILIPADEQLLKRSGGCSGGSGSGGHPHTNITNDDEMNPYLTSSSFYFKSLGSFSCKCCYCKGCSCNSSNGEKGVGSGKCGCECGCNGADDCSDGNSVCNVSGLQIINILDVQSLESYQLIPNGFQLTRKIKYISLKEHNESPAVNASNSGTALINNIQQQQHQHHYHQHHHHSQNYHTKHDSLNSSSSSFLFSSSSLTSSSSSSSSSSVPPISTKSPQQLHHQQGQSSQYHHHHHHHHHQLHQLLSTPSSSLTTSITTASSFNQSSQQESFDPLFSPPMNMIIPPPIQSSVDKGITRSNNNCGSDDISSDDDDDDDDDDIIDRNCVSAKSTHSKTRGRRKVSIKMPDGEDSDDENSDTDNDVGYDITNDDVSAKYPTSDNYLLMSPQSQPSSSTPPSTTSEGHSRLQMTSLKTTRMATVNDEVSHFIQSGIAITSSNPYSLSGILKNFIPIDKFFGFYHYYHNNKDHALAWWRNYCL